MEDLLPDWVRTGIVIFIVLYFNYRAERNTEKNVKRHKEFFLESDTSDERKSRRYYFETLVVHEEVKHLMLLVLGVLGYIAFRLSV